MTPLNARFLKEAKELEERWANLPDGFIRGMTAGQMTAINLECQRLHNETGNWDCCDECKEREKNESTDPV
jgi:hypothetical protein